MDTFSNELRELYLQTSKHSNYQILPYELAEVLKINEENIHSRFEKERLNYICKRVEIEGKRILDIGGNTGYFTFECIKGGCQRVDYFEGNQIHAEFVHNASKIFDRTKLEVHNSYYLFDENEKKYDVVLCLNVIHHLGADFFVGNNMEDAKKVMLECINALSYTTEYMVFQMGYNWCGDRNRCLFENGTKKELEDFLFFGVGEFWNIINIGIAVKNKGIVRYEDKNDVNNIRNDELGEFLNRPIFIMKSKKLGDMKNG